MGILSGIGFGEYHHHGNLRTALAGLGRVTQGKTAQLTKQSRGVVADFVRGEVSEGSCSKDGSCAVKSDGMKLIVDGETLASRDKPSADTIKVCVPSRVSYDPAERDPKSGKLKKKAKIKQKDRELVAASAALMRILGTGIGSRTVGRAGERVFSSGSMRKHAARVMVPGQCVEVRLTPEMVDEAALMQAGRARAQAALPAGGKLTRKMVKTEAKKISKERADARAAELKAKREMALAKARAARSAAAALKKQAAAAKAAGAPAAAAAATQKAAQATAVAQQATAVAAQAGAAATAVKKAVKKAAAAQKAAAPKKKKAAKKNEKV